MPLHIPTYYNSRPFRQRNFRSLYVFGFFYFVYRNVPIKKENKMSVFEKVRLLNGFLFQLVYYPMINAFFALIN